MAYRSFQVIAQAKLVNFTILAALFCYNSLNIIPEAAIILVITLQYESWLKTPF